VPPHSESLEAETQLFGELNLENLINLLEMNLFNELAYQAYLSIYLIWHIRDYIAERSLGITKRFAPNLRWYRLQRDRIFITTARQVRDRLPKMLPE
jgi:hypothetical protein